MNFPNHAKLEEYKTDIQFQIMETAKKCDSAMFIFDEIDKMPLGLIGSIKAFIDYHFNVKGVDLNNIQLSY